MASGDLLVRWEPSLVRKPLMETTQHTCWLALSHFRHKGSGDGPAEATSTMDPTVGVRLVSGGSWSLCRLDLRLRATASTPQQPEVRGRCRPKPCVHLLDPTNKQPASPRKVDQPICLDSPNRWGVKRNLSKDKRAHAEVQEILSPDSSASSAVSSTLSPHELLETQGVSTSSISQKRAKGRAHPPLKALTLFQRPVWTLTSSTGNRDLLWNKVSAGELKDLTGAPKPNAGCSRKEEEALTGPQGRGRCVDRGRDRGDAPQHRNTRS